MSDMKFGIEEKKALNMFTRAMILRSTMSIYMLNKINKVSPTGDDTHPANLKKSSKEGAI
jgi:hypothetical protein|tara:strand:- start:63 stop:242 length:180 start_codon:yes stop_codon:yes gene_type:complete